MSVYRLCDLTEALSCDALHLIKKHQSPFVALDEFHHIVCFVCSLSIETKHTVSTDEDESLILDLFFIDIHGV